VLVFFLPHFPTYYPTRAPVLIPRNRSNTMSVAQPSVERSLCCLMRFYRLRCGPTGAYFPLSHLSPLKGEHQASFPQRDSN
jgi:hypothetical protein